MSHPTGRSEKNPALSLLAKFVGLLLTALLLATLFVVGCGGPADIRTDKLKDGPISEQAATEGRALIEAMQSASGGLEHWQSAGVGAFVQTAEWFEAPLKLAGWDAVPQRFEMVSSLGTGNCRMALQNGPTRGDVWGVREGVTYTLVDGAAVVREGPKYLHKMRFKNYWFQFPFRIHEAPIVASAGQAEVDGTLYDLVFATWGSASANETYDQYILYIHPETRFVEWLHFTVRGEASMVEMSARFSDFREADGFTLPHKQEVSLGRPGGVGKKMHENTYHEMRFGRAEDKALLEGEAP